MVDIDFSPAGGLFESSGGLLFVSDPLKGVICGYSKSMGTMTTFSNTQSFKFPTFITGDNNCNLFVADRSKIWKCHYSMDDTGAKPVMDEPWELLREVPGMDVRFLKLFGDRLFIYDGVSKKVLFCNGQGEIQDERKLCGGIKSSSSTVGFEISLERKEFYLSYDCFFLKYDWHGELVFRKDFSSIIPVGGDLRKLHRAVEKNHEMVYLVDSKTNHLFRIRL
ncbi:MAG: hypothetical protein GY765_40765 [bacterium]|nr:hypothetical protein [bacterium]